MFKYTLIELKELRKLENNLAISSEELESLCYYFRKYYDNFDEIFLEPSLHICGCIGAIDGNPYCACSMIRNIFKYRFEIALYILENDLEMIDRSEEIAKEHLELQQKLREIFGNGND
jgi:hypothetical protein